MNQRLVPLANIAREDDLAPHVVLLSLDLQHRRAQDVARLTKHDRDVLGDRLALIVRNRFQQFECLVHVPVVEQRFGLEAARTAFAPMPLFLVGDVFCLNMCRIAQHDLDQIGCGRRAINGAFETVSHQSGNQAAMVNMGVRQQQGIDGIQRQRAFVPIA